jgi:hypothetical protein
MVGRYPCLVRWMVLERWLITQSELVIILVIKIHFFTLMISSLIKANTSPGVYILVQKWNLFPPPSFQKCYFSPHRQVFFWLLSCHFCINSFLFCIYFIILLPIFSFLSSFFLFLSLFTFYIFSPITLADILPPPPSRGDEAFSNI